MTNQCEHGQLARQCEVCERDERIRKLDNKVARQDAKIKLLRTDNAQLNDLVRSRRERIEQLRGQVEAARELKVRLEEVAGRFPASSAWWCPHCGETECAYNGTCTKCGVRIEDNQPGDEWINSIESAITKATEAGV